MIDDTPIGENRCVHFPLCGCGGRGAIDSACWPQQPPQSETASLQGTWPANDLRRAFVDGAKWWEWISEDATMWSSDVRRAEAEAEKRFASSTTPERK